MKVLFVFVFIEFACCSVIPDGFAEQVETSEFEHLKQLIEDEDKTTVVDVVIAEGYPVENHYVTTSDGYILNVHRIPSGKNGAKNGKVAFLQHGLLLSSFDWVISGSGKSLGYILADEGYDVWMGNARGNTYSRNHTTLNPDRDSEFWNFSWHEMGYIDVPAMIDYILEQTGADGIYYTGHSQGTTVFYVMASTRPEYNEKIKAAVSLAPIAFMKHMTSPLMKILAAWNTPISALLSIIGIDEFLPSDGFLSMAAESICSDGIGQVLCKNSLFAICGFSNGQMNTTLLPTIMAHSPAGASTRQLLHYGQEIKSGKFRWYDLGLVQNKIVYGSLSPPDYDLSQITAPVYLIYSANDWLAAEVDVRKLCSGLGNCVQQLLVTDSKFNHLDFTLGIDAPTLVYSHVVNIFATA